MYINIHAKIINKIQITQNLQNTESIIDCEQVGFIMEMQNWVSIQKSLSNIQYTSNKINQNDAIQKTEK